MKNPYTVVGLYPDTNEVFVDWLHAESVKDVRKELRRVRQGNFRILAIFEGHHEMKGGD